MNFIGTHNIFLHFFEENAPFFRKIFHLRIHAEFSKPRDTFQNEENEGSIFDSKTRNGPNRGMFITVFKIIFEILFLIFIFWTQPTKKIPLGRAGKILPAREPHPHTAPRTAPYPHPHTGVW